MGIPDAADDAHTMSRRGFLVGAAAVTAVAVLPVATAGRASAATLSKAPATLVRSTFMALLGSSFKILDGSGHAATVVLSEIGDLGAASAGSETQFSLMFDGPATMTAPQATYSFRNSRLADVRLFAVPVDRGISAKHYQVVIYSSS